MWVLKYTEKLKMISKSSVCEINNQVSNARTTRLEKLGESRLGLGRKGKSSRTIQPKFSITFEYATG